jgi:hypothetical protein
MDGVISVGRKELAIYRHGINVLEGRLSITEFSLLSKKSYRQAQRIIKKLRISEKKSPSKH